MHALVRDVFLAAFGAGQDHDAHVQALDPGRIATTTDSYVVNPLFFRGGDIGALATHGTINDLAMCGARPLYLAAAFILEEGVRIADLQRIAASMARACAEVGVHVRTGDTKVVERGKGDGVYITTTGVGLCEHTLHIHPHSIRDDDVIVLSGDVGRHGMAVMSTRENLQFDSAIESDCRELWSPVRALLEAGIDIHCLRDLTRGGLATALVELAASASLEFELDEDAVSVQQDVRAACELLGMDPLYVANEGRFVAVVPRAQAERTVAILARAGAGSPRIAGRVFAGHAGQVSLRTRLGTLRHLAMLSGEQLPRIC
jgi:hydrogenase expression/formation protein HypE